MDLVTDAVDANAVATSGANEVRDTILSDATTFPGAAITDLRLGELDPANLPADVASIQADTDDIQARLPAALVGGRLDSDVAIIRAPARQTIANTLETSGTNPHGTGAWDATATVRSLMCLPEQYCCAAASRCWHGR